MCSFLTNLYMSKIYQKKIQAKSQRKKLPGKAHVCAACFIRQARWKMILGWTDEVHGKFP